MTTSAQRCPACNALDTLQATCPRCGLPLQAWRDLITLPDRLRERADQMMQRKDYDGAAASLQAARTLDPDSSQGIKRLAYCLMQAGQYEQALRHLASAAPEDSTATELREECIRSIDRQQSVEKKHWAEREGLERSVQLYKNRAADLEAYCMQLRQTIASMGYPPPAYIPPKESPQQAASPAPDRPAAKASAAKSAAPKAKGDPRNTSNKRKRKRKK